MHKYQLGTVIKYYDETRKGIAHFGEIIEIRTRKDLTLYLTQDGKLVKEPDVKAEFFECIKVEHRKEYQNET